MDGFVLGVLGGGWPTTSSEIRVVSLTERDGAEAAHLVVGLGDDDRADAHLPDDESARDTLWDTRVVPFARNLAAGRRAPRRRRAVLVGHDPAWAAAAARIAARLRAGLGERALRVDHVGSTSVPGLPAKDLLDLQVVVPSLEVLDDDRWWRRAGVVPVAGRFYGIDRHDREHDQRVAVDADPGRPLNVHLHPEGSPVWREFLAFRDRLRDDEAYREEYRELKQGLAAASDHVDAYSSGKRAWINGAVRRAMDG